MLMIIDGHNLIPHVDGLALDDPDDERRLLELLQQYARLKRRQVLVFFDKAAPGRAGERTFGTVKAYFVPASTTADDAIAQKLRAMSKSARQQARVVTSDHRVQAEARSLGVAVIDSPAFARELRDVLSAPPAPGLTAEAKEPAASADLGEWYDLFNLDPHEAEQPLEPEKTRARKKGGQPPSPSPSKTPTQRKRRYHGFDKKPG